VNALYSLIVLMCR